MRNIGGVEALVGGRNLAFGKLWYWNVLPRRVRPHRLACPSCGGVVAKIILNRNRNRNRKWKLYGRVDPDRERRYILLSMFNNYWTRRHKETLMCMFSNSIFISRLIVTHSVYPSMPTICSLLAIMIGKGGDQSWPRTTTHHTGHV